MAIIGDKITEIFGALMRWIYDALVLPFKDLGTLNTLIFGSEANSNLIWGTFQPDELTKAYLPIFNVMMTFAIFAFVAFIVFSGVRIASSQVLPTRRNEAIESIKDLIIVGVLLMNLPSIYNLLFYVNTSIVNVFSSAYKVGVSSELAEDASLGHLLVGLIMLGITIWANFYYLMRKITLLILMAMGPIMITCIMFPRWKPVVGTWFKELSGTIFVQAIHAGVFWTISMVAIATTDFITSVFIYVIFIPLSEQIRRLLGMGGDTASGMNKFAGMAGLAALGTVAGAVKGIAGGNSAGVKTSTKGSKETSNSGTDDLKKAPGASAGDDSGTTKAGANMLKAGDIASKAGKAVMTSAGAVAGMALGPIGSIVGGKVGDGVGGAAGVIGRGGAAGAMGAKKLAQAGMNKLKEGKEAFNNSLDKDSLKDVEKELEDTLTEKGMNDWDTNMAEGIKKDLQQKFPDATNEEIDNKVAGARKDFEKNLRSATKDQITSAKELSNGTASAKALTEAAVNSGSAQWAKNNREAFKEQYAKDFPQSENESDEAFEERSNNDFNNKVSDVRSKLSSVAEGLGKGGQLVSKAAFKTAMSGAVSGLGGDVSNVTSAMDSASNAVQGASVLTSNGIPNISNLSQSLAGAATRLQGNQFVDEQVASGVSEEVARETWAGKEAGVHANNVTKYSSPEMEQSLNAINKTASLSSSNAKSVMSATAAAVGTTMMLPELKEFADKTGASVMTGLQAYSNADGMVASAKEGLSAFGSSMVAVPNGQAVQAESNFANKVAMGAGVVLGTGAYAAAKKFATNHSPYKGQVEAQISSPSEVMQQALTTTDDYGNTQIAPGAIRQVITPNSSHVEVLTKGGERKIVSRNGSGHSGMASGDKVYQDLQVKNDMIVPSDNGSTYRLDSGGARIPSSVVVQSSPNQLLGNPLRSNSNGYKPQPVPSSFSQSVDNGGFHTEDISKNGINDLSVVVTKTGQYLQGMKQGSPVRLSPIFAGDSRLSGSDSLNIPVDLVNNQIIANKVLGENSVQGFLKNGIDPSEYFSSKGVGGFVESKHIAHAEKIKSRKEELDYVRRNQGIVG